MLSLLENNCHQIKIEMEKCVEEQKESRKKEFKNEISKLVKDLN